MIEPCTTHKLVHELQKKPRNTTNDDFPFSKAMQSPKESLETGYSWLKELGSHCKFENMEENLVKHLFISNMRTLNIQMEFLSEMGTAQV